jgi:hypothetical protein
MAARRIATAGGLAVAEHLLAPLAEQVVLLLLLLLCRGV